MSKHWQIHSIDVRFLHLVASGDSLLACSPVTLGVISFTPSLFHFAEGHAGRWYEGSRTFLSLKETPAQYIDLARAKNDALITKFII